LLLLIQKKLNYGIVTSINFGEADCLKI